MLILLWNSNLLLAIKTSKEKYNKVFKNPGMMVETQQKVMPDGIISLWHKPLAFHEIGKQTCQILKGIGLLFYLSQNKNLYILL